MQLTKDRVHGQIDADVHNNYLYQALDFFMLRTPVFPIEFLKFDRKQESDAKNVTYIKYFLEAIRDPVFREAIAVASLSLYNSLEKIDEYNFKKTRQVIQSILSYYIRMASRPTPFGLFSGVGIGVFGEKTEVLLNKEFKKNSRADMQWLFNVVKNLEKDSSLLSNLYVKSNNLLYRHGDMMKIPYFSDYGIKENSTINDASFRITAVLEDVLVYTKSPILFKDLIHKLQKKYIGVSEEKIYSYLHNMIEKEFLLTELRPPFLEKSPFDYVLNKVKLAHPNLAQNPFYQDLVSIRKEIAKYNTSELGDGEELYLNLTKKMTEITKTKHTLQVDLKLGIDKAQLKKSIKNDIERAAEIFYMISTRKKGFKHMKMFYEDFVDKYGFYSEVPILELLDNGLGLGSPPTYINPPSMRKYDSNDKNTKRDFILFSWITECFVNGETKINLTDQMIDKLKGFKNVKDAPDSIDIYFTIGASSQEAIDRGDYTLVIGPNGGSFGAGKTFGRFAYMFDDKISDKLERIHKLEQDLNPESIFAEVTYLPSSSRVVNVMLNPSKREYEIPIGTNSSKDKAHTLDLSDLVVGASSEGLYLKSLSLCKEVIPVTGHMVNHINGVPNIYRFLIELGYQRQSMWEPFNWGELDKSPFLPRIQYKNIILSPATWQFNRLINPFDKVSNEDNWEEILLSWREKYKVPTYVYISDYDNRIILDLENKIHQKIIYRKFCKLQGDESLMFTELGFQFKDNWVSSSEDKDKRFFMEGVFPLLKRPEYQGTEMERRLVLPKTKSNYISKINRYKIVGSEWLYLKLYGPSERIDELIYDQIRVFCKKIKSYGLIQHSFFMRYADPKPHIRLRFKGDSNILVSQLIPHINNWINILLNRGLIDEINYESYNPEIERYGGADYIGLAEELFSDDSAVSGEIIAWREFHGREFNSNLLVVISIVHILELSGLSKEKQLSWLKRVVSDPKQPREFRENKKLFVHLANSFNNWSNLKSHSQ
ncbi:lantibiotic dehydratase, partial [Bacillus subtilis]|uniref:lantibiotic dehydratase n=1 Tax=Bacillus subtilis TaxID=1423 RepID=UPI0022815C5A